MAGTRDAYVLAMASLATGWYRAKLAGPTAPLIAPPDVEELIVLGTMAKRLSGYDPAAPAVVVPPGETINLTIPPEAIVPPAAEAPAEPAAS